MSEGRQGDAFDGWSMVPMTGAAAGKGVKSWTAIIWVGVAAGVLSLGLHLVGAIFGGSDTAPGAETAAASQTAGLAGAAVNAWIGGTDLPEGASLCAGPDAPFDDVVSVDWQRSVRVSGTDEIHFFVVNADDRIVSVSSTVRDVVDPATNTLRTVVAGCPTITLTSPPPPAEPSPEPWAGWPVASGSMPDRFGLQVDAWADAFFSDDADALYRVTSDTDPLRSYQPAGDVWEVLRTEIVYGSIDVDRGGALAQVTVVTDRGAFSYDMLFGDPDAALPAVLSWGPVGSGSSLTPFLNAVVGTVDTMSGPAPTLVAPETLPPLVELPETPATVVDDPETTNAADADSDDSPVDSTPPTTDL